jgi:hypothetical protein
MPEERHSMAPAHGRAAGKKGGKARVDKLTPERQCEIGREAVVTRWANRPNARQTTDEDGQDN